MRSIALVIALVAALIAPAFAQKAEIEAVNAKWIDFFNKGDFAGIAAREIGTFSVKPKGPTPQEVTGKYLVVWEKVGSDCKLVADIWNEGK
jgi:ketosteroid isomerase-like protein